MNFKEFISEELNKFYVIDIRVKNQRKAVGNSYKSVETAYKKLDSLPNPKDFTIATKLENGRWQSVSREHEPVGQIFDVKA